MAQQFELVREAPAPVPTEEKQESEARDILAQIVSAQMSIKSLSMKAAIAVSHLVSLIALGTVFASWLYILESPTINQLVGCAAYSVFVLMAEWVRRK